LQIKGWRRQPFLFLQKLLQLCGTGVKVLGIINCGQSRSFTALKGLQKGKFIRLWRIYLMEL